VIELFADEATIRKQVMSMVTDTQRILRTQPGRPEVCNVCQLHRFFSPDDYETIWDGERTARTGCVDTKRLLADRIIGTFAEAREKRRELDSRPGYVEEILRAGAEKLLPMATETMRQCHDLMGLGPR
jgi:tryptophanyl-tRNA synthetase